MGTKQNIFARYKEIKKNNEALKATTYSEFWKQTATTQHRLLSTFDTEKGQFQLTFLDLQFQSLKCRRIQSLNILY